ncbi:MAG TPA: phosphatidate cytidylyltransferase [Candidatus Cloacimonadota bacterium]|nr:phosphatidate cytidylyltransferase [Candidatus Cloacimonadota bacterium]HQL14902.1 phosphatidate cytidylyltransferase [Candidatus Cloacimonadota bacterium]
MNKNLKHRLIVAVIGIPVLLFIFYAGGWYLFAFLALLSGIGMWEYSRMLCSGSKYAQAADVFTSLIFFLLVSGVFREKKINISLSFLIIIIQFIKFLVLLRGEKAFQKCKYWFRAFLGWCYTGILPGLIFLLNEQYGEQRYLLLLLLLIWLTDSTAYFIGMKFGRHRGIFPVSPNKSLEGFLAGIIVSWLLIAVLFLSGMQFKIIPWILLAVGAGIFGQVGDLLESKIKRTAGVKDSGKLILGHGGVLDRFDSLLIAAPMLFVMLKIFF